MSLSNSAGDEGWTNAILVDHQKEKTVYYVPCYLRLKVKNFISVFLSSQEAEINADLLFSVYYGSLPQFTLQELQQNIILQFNRNDAINLAKSIDISIINNQKSQVLSFTIRKNLKCKIDCNFFWSPFELIYLVLVVTIRSMILTHPKTHSGITIRFNLMDHESRSLKISYTKEDEFGNYKLASKKLKVYYSRQLYYDPEQSNKEQEQATELITLEDLYESAEHLHEEPQFHNEHEKVGYFQYAHFVIPMYKYPFISLFTIFFPMWSLSLYNLFMYYQGIDMSMRISNGATLILALFAYVPTIRQQLPNTPSLLLVQILIYSIGITFHLTLIQSYVVEGYDSTTYQMEWTGDIYFILSISITIVSAVIVFVLSLIHKCKWERSYLDSQEKFEEKFDKTSWRNFECDHYFKKYPSIKALH